MDFVSPVHEPLKNEDRPCTVVTVTFSTIYVNLASLTTSFGSYIVYFLIQNKNIKLKKLSNYVRSKQY